MYLEFAVILLRASFDECFSSASQQFEAFSDTCRLAMCWLSSHALSDYLNEVILEAVVASVFLKPFSIQPPRFCFLYIAFLSFFCFLVISKMPLLLTEVDGDRLINLV